MQAHGGAPRGLFLSCAFRPIPLKYHGLPALVHTRAPAGRIAEFCQFGAVQFPSEIAAKHMLEALA